MGIRYMGTGLDSSGYGSANRADIVSLYVSGVDLTTELIAQTTERTDFGWNGNLCDALRDRQIDYKIKILHITPDLYPVYMEKGKYNIGRLMWEVDKLPKEWVNPCNQTQEIWTATEPQAKMIRDSGVTVPIYAFPQPLDVSLAESNFNPLAIPNFEGTIFYSIFQWIDRKNPKALLTSYWKAFEGRKDVMLVLKTYGVNYNDTEFMKIKAHIAQWKLELGLSHYPKIFLVNKLMNTRDVFRLHKTGSVFVSTSRGEGWNRPAVEAMMMGNPVVHIDQTGFADVLPKDLFYPIKCSWSKVKPVPSIPWYQSHHSWLDIHEEELINTLKEIEAHPEEVKERGKKAQAYVKEFFNYWIVGEQLKERLSSISKFL